MDAEIKQKWVEALRSGKYIQAKGQLYSREESRPGKLAMCCLGVLEHICGTPLEEMNPPDNEEYDFKEVAFPNQLNHPNSPEEFMDTEDIDSLSNTLANMNDGNSGRGIKRRSFEEIADYIEKNL